MIYSINKQKRISRGSSFEKINYQGNINKDIYQLVADGYAAKRLIRQNMAYSSEESEKKELS